MMFYYIYVQQAYHALSLFVFDRSLLFFLKFSAFCAGLLVKV